MPLDNLGDVLLFDETTDAARLDSAMEAILERGADLVGIISYADQSAFLQDIRSRNLIVISYG